MFSSEFVIVSYCRLWHTALLAFFKYLNIVSDTCIPNTKPFAGRYFCLSCLEEFAKISHRYRFTLLSLTSSTSRQLSPCAQCYWHFTGISARVAFLSRASMPSRLFPDAFAVLNNVIKLVNKHLMLHLSQSCLEKYLQCTNSWGLRGLTMLINCSASRASLEQFPVWNRQMNTAVSQSIFSSTLVPFDSINLFISFSTCYVSSCRVWTDL